MNTQQEARKVAIASVFIGSLKMDISLKSIIIYPNCGLVVGWELRSMIMDCAIQRAPFDHLYPQAADDIADALEEYGLDNDLPEGWWCEECDIDEIIERI